MIPNMTVLVLLALLMTIGSVIAVTAKSLTSSVVSMGTSGLILSILFLVLGAPDMAITQVFVEIVVLVVLLSIIIKESSIDTGTSGLYSGIILAVSVFFFVGFLFYTGTALRPLGEPVMTMGLEYLKYSAPLTNTADVVTATILDFRAYDTLGEVAIIFTAVVGVIVLLRQKGRKDE